MLASVLLFFGIFAATTTGPIPSHVPQAAGARAIGANASLASATRDTDSSITEVQCLLLVLTLLLFRPAIARRSQIEPEIDSTVRFRFARPALLFRPPPVFSHA